MATRKTAPAKKAPAKSAASKPNRNAAWNNVQLPAGFRAITSGAYGEQWDYENNPLLQGTVASEVREVEMGKGRDKRTSRVVTIKSSDDGKSYTLWESASLKAFFDHLRVGQEVAVVFHGYKDVGRLQPMKDFEGAFTDEDADAIGAEDEPLPRRPAAKKAAKKTTRRR